jgi:histidinol-phosphate aminotransferase
MDANQVEVEQIACIIFSVTPDLDAAFPATGVRLAGLTTTPLFSTREIPVPGSLPRCIRALMLVTSNLKQEEMRHIYLGEATKLRPDLSTVQTDMADEPGAGIPSYRKTVLNIAPYQPGKPISELRREKGLTDVIKLASNENPLGPSPKALAAVQQSLTSLHIYPDGNCFELRQALAKRLGVEGMELIFGNGSDEVIKMLGVTFLEPGDEVLVCEPTFSEYAYAANLMGAKLRTLPLKDHAFDLEGMLAAVNPKTKIVFICNPNNPTGAYVDKGAVDDFLAKIPEHVLVVFDEAYYEYVTAEDYPETIEYVKEGRNVVVLRTFSKIHGLAGLRIGYGVAPGHIAQLVHRVREPFNVNSAAQVAALAALDDDEHVTKSRDLNETGKAWLYQELTKLRLEYVPSQTNFIFIDLKRDSQEVYHGLLDRGVIARSGGVFGCPTWLRVTIGTAEENRRFIEALAEVMER